MVNVDKINNTIEELELQAKEIISVVEKQKKLEKIITDINELKLIISRDTKEIVEITDNINKLFNMSESIANGIEELIDKEFLNIKDYINGYNENIKNLAKISENIKHEINSTNGSIVKNLSEIKVENYKMINDFQVVLESKLGLLKSDTNFEIKNCEDAIKSNINKNFEEIVHTFNDNNKKLTDLIKNIYNLSEKNLEIINYNKKSLDSILDIIKENNKESVTRDININTKIDKFEKKNTILLAIITVLTIINIAVIFMK